MRRSLTPAAALALTASVLAGCTASAEPATYFAYDDAPAAAMEEAPPLSSEELGFWDDAVFALVRGRKLPPTEAARLFAYIAVAQRDAALLAEQTHGAMRLSVGPVTSKVLCLFFPEDCPEILRYVSADSSSEAAADLVVAAVRERMIEEAALKRPYRAKGDPHAWHGENPVTPDAGSWKTWLVERGSDFRAPPPPPHASPEDFAEIDAVRAAVAGITEEQRAAVKRWAGGPGTETPAGLWLKIGNDRMREAGMSPAEMLDARALLAMTMADAFIACWDTKFTYWTARPNMADPALVTLIPTPNFPSYTSGHSTVSAAAAAVLSYLFPQETDRWRAMAEEARDSRLWGGIHFPVDNAEGFAMGERLAQAAIPSFR